MTAAFADAAAPLVPFAFLGVSGLLMAAFAVSLVRLLLRWAGRTDRPDVPE